MLSAQSAFCNAAKVFVKALPSDGIISRYCGGGFCVPQQSG
jgi:hypothetical protein